jgi:Na+/proline symporter
LLTAVVAIAAAWVGAQGYSVLALFLTADLLAAATFLPLLAGLYTGRLTGRGALSASLAGLLVGLAFFPTLRGLVGTVVPTSLLPGTSFFYAFFGAAIVSGGLAVLASQVTGSRYDLGRLGREIGRLDERDPATDGGTRTSRDAPEKSNGTASETDDASETEERR